MGATSPSFHYLRFFERSFLLLFRFRIFRWAVGLGLGPGRGVQTAVYPLYAVAPVRTLTPHPSFVPKHHAR